MNLYRNKKTGAILEIPSEFGSDAVWEKISPAPAATQVKAGPEKKVEAPKKSATKKAVKK